MFQEIQHHRPVYRNRLYTAIAQLASTGLSLRVELARLLGIAPSSPAFKKLIKSLQFHDIIVSFNIPLGISSNITIIQLTDYAKDRLSNYGISCVESDYERIVRLHDGENQPKHTAQVLFAAYQARLRGYTVKVMPFEMGDGRPWHQPDLTIKDENHVYSVEVETHSRNKPIKWTNKRVVNVVLPNPVVRQAVVTRLKNLHVPGRATDLQTLARNAKKGEIDYFWLERW